MRYVTDILAALNFGFGLGWLALIVLLLVHLNRRLRLGDHEWAAIRLVVFFGLMSACERITLGILATPSRLLNVNDVSPWLYLLPITFRFLGALGVWGAVLWTVAVFWPSLGSERKND